MSLKTVIVILSFAGITTAGTSYAQQMAKFRQDLLRHNARVTMEELLNRNYYLYDGQRYEKGSGLYSLAQRVIRKSKPKRFFPNYQDGQNYDEMSEDIELLLTEECESRINNLRNEVKELQKVIDQLKTKLNDQQCTDSEDKYLTSIEQGSSQNSRENEGANDSGDNDKYLPS